MLPCGESGGVLARCIWCACCSAFLRCVATFVEHSCAAVTCWRYHVAASGGQEGIGGLRFLGSALCANAPSVPCGCTAAALQSRCARPARALLGFSSHPFVPPPLRWGWRRRGGAFLRGALPLLQGLGSRCALRSSVALRLARRSAAGAMSWYGRSFIPLQTHPARPKAAPGVFIGTGVWDLRACGLR